MKANFQPIRLTQARSLKMLNMTELAERTGLTRQAISQYEKGMAPSGEKLRELAKALDVSERFFTKPLSDTEQNQHGVPSFRSMSSASAKARKQAHSYLELMAHISGSLTDYVRFPEVRLPDFNIKDFVSLTDEDIENIAAKTRGFFGLGNGPISDVSLLLENHGVVIGQIELHKKLDALCSWFDNRPFVLVSPNATAVRIRFDLSHELGHLLLHKDLIDVTDIQDRETLKLIEHQANYFAGCFLMPESSFVSEVYSLTLGSLTTLKERWKVSIAAMVMRLSQVGFISESQKKRLFQMLIATNSRRHEPLDDVLEKEKPRLFNKILKLLKDSTVIGGGELLELTGLPRNIFSCLTGVPEHDLIDVVNLDNVVLLRS